jgi:hypothetical protein
MPVIEEGAVTSFDVPSNKLDISNQFYKLEHPETPFYNKISVGDKLVSDTAKWLEDGLYPAGTKLSAAYTAAGGSITVVSTQGIRVDMILQIEDSTYKVTAINRTTKVVTIAIVANDANHASGKAVNFLNTARIQGASGQESDYTPEEWVENYTQIVDDFVSVTGTQQVIERYAGNPDLLADMVDKKLKRIVFNLARALFANPRVKAANKTEASIAGGVDFFTTLRGYAPAASAFSTDNFDAFLFEMSQVRGAAVSEAWMNPSEMSNFISLHADKLIVDRGDEKAGRVIKSYISKYGFEVNLNMDSSIPVKKIFIAQPSMVRIRPLRPIVMENLRNDGDNKKADIRGELTFEINPSNRLGCFKVA